MMLRVASVALCVASVSGHGCITWPTSRNAVDAHEISCDANTDGCRCGTSLPPSPPPASVCPPAPLLLSRAQPHGAWDWLCQRNAPGAALHERTGFILVQPRVSHRGLCVQLLHWLPHVRPPDCPLCSSVSSCFIGCPTCDHLSGRRQTDLCGLGKKATLPQYARSVNLKAPRFSELDVYQVCLALCLSLSLSQLLTMALWAAQPVVSSRLSSGRRRVWPRWWLSLGLEPRGGGQLRQHFALPPRPKGNDPPGVADRHQVEDRRGRGSPVASAQQPRWRLLVPPVPSGLSAHRSMLQEAPARFQPRESGIAVPGRLAHDDQRHVRWARCCNTGRDRSSGFHVGENPNRTHLSRAGVHPRPARRPQRSTLMRGEEQPEENRPLPRRPVRLFALPTDARLRLLSLRRLRRAGVPPVHAQRPAGRRCRPSHRHGGLGEGASGSAPGQVCSGLPVRPLTQLARLVPAFGC